MLVGYNTNIPYKGKLYHVQTEDNGLRNPVIITLLYYKGTILATKKSSYAQVKSDPNYKDLVREMMKEQHKAMMKELIAGRHTEPEGEDQPAAQPAAVPETAAPEAATEPSVPQPAAAEAAKAQISRSLDDVLLDYILKRDE